MPVMYVAIGRRLGYPLRLVTTNAHLFVRWDGEEHVNPSFRGRFNIEGAGNGFGSYPDDYYKTWPHRVTEEEVRANGYLVSLTPEQEFAEFLAARGHCGLDNGEFRFAARCYENAHRYDPGKPAFRSWFLDAAIPGGYEPQAPALIALLDQRREMRVAARRNPGAAFDNFPMPSQASTLGFPEVPGSPTAFSSPHDGLRHPRSGAVAVPRLPVSTLPESLSPNAQSSPFRSQP